LEHDGVCGPAVAFFDHTHNLPMQLLVELGLPWAILVLGLLSWRCGRPLRSLRATGEDKLLRRCGFMLCCDGHPQPA